VSEVQRPQPGLNGATREWILPIVDFPDRN